MESNKKLPLHKTPLGKFILNHREFIEGFTVWFHVVMSFLFFISSFSALGDGRQEAGLLYGLLTLNFTFTALSEHQNFSIKRLQRNTIETYQNNTDELIKNYEDFILLADEKKPNALLTMKNQIKELRIKRAESLKELDKKM